MRHFGLPLILICLVLVRCDSGSDEPDESESGRLILSMQQIVPFPGNSHMEGWIVLLNEPNRSIGKFNVNQSGVLVDLAGNPITTGQIDTEFALEDALAMFVTIEPSGDADDIPSETRLMGGLFVDGQAALRAADVEGIEDELILAAGNYIVDSPTDGPGTNETSGIWFVNLTGGPPARGLRVAIPIQGWHYQGWAEFDGIAVNMGVITHHSRPDESSLYSGPTLGYNYPGEDFLVNAPDGLTFPVPVANAKVFVTLEPAVDQDPAPSQFVLFEGRVPTEPAPNVTYDMVNLIDEFPTGTAVIVQ